MSRNTDPKPSLTQNNHQANEKSPTPIDAGRKQEPSIRDVYQAKQLTGVARFIYAILASHANEKNRPAWIKEEDRPVGFLAWPSIQTLADESGFSARSVRYGVRDLVEAGFIQNVFPSKGGQPKTKTSSVFLVGRSLQMVQPSKPRTLQTVQSSTAKKPAKSAGEKPATGATELSKKKELSKGVERIEKDIRSTPTPRAREALSPKTDDGGDKCDYREPNPDLLNEPVTAKHFEWLEALTDNEQITCIGRRTILRCSKQFGFTLPELAYAFKKSGMTRVGGIIKLAEDWPAQSRIIQWPSCRKCLGEGIIAFPSAPHGVAACDCAEGKRLAAQDQVTAERRTEDVSYAEWCRYNGRSHADYEACIAAEKAAAERRTAYTNAGTCPWCEGTGTVSSSNRRCGRCRGLGITERPEGSCDRCWGTGFHGYDADGKHQECISCWNKRVTKAQNTPRAIIPAPKPSQSSGPVYREL